MSDSEVQERIRNVTLHYPRRLAFGSGSLEQMAKECSDLGLSRLFVLVTPSISQQIHIPFNIFQKLGISVEVYISRKGEPDFADFDSAVREAREFKADSVAGIGGGSVLDVAKLVAALLYSEQTVQSIVGNGLLHKRGVHLICVPTTAGAGSEASPNAILIDQKDGSKKGIISQYLLPDSVYLDPALSTGVPPLVTAYTGIDALTHCIEAYVNRSSHPLVDGVALEGIRLISRYLKRAVDQGDDQEARLHLAMGSFYGGMCLGPVNTAAVHALAYPLGTKFRLPHGLSNALLLPHVMQFNLSFAEKRYATVALTMGAKPGNSYAETAENGISLVRKLIADCGLPSRLSHREIQRDSIEEMARSALQIQRLLKNNVREIGLEEAIDIYESAY